jgi:hypothetical protein
MDIINNDLSAVGNCERIIMYVIFIRLGKSERKKPFEIPRRRWENNIKMDSREIGWKIVVWMHMAQDRDQWRPFVNTTMNLRVP